MSFAAVGRGRAAAACAGFILASAMSGCTGDLVETRPRVKGPVSAVGWIDVGGGQAKYSLRGGRWAVEARRQDVLSKIEGYCGGAGKYKIVDEVDRSETEVPFTAGDVEDTLSEGDKHYRKAGYHHVYFECLP